MSLSRRVAVLTLSAALAGCSASSPATGPPATAAPTPTRTSAGPFLSPRYGYVVTSPDWSGESAVSAWDGTGSPGNGDPFVDVLTGPTPNTFAFGERTNATLADFVAALRTAGAKDRGCPKPDTTTKLTIGGAPALLDAGSCNGVFTQTAYVVQAGRAYAFVMFDQPGSEAAERASFASLLKAVSLAP